jgi:NAD(P) transhydrogenase
MTEPYDLVVIGAGPAGEKGAVQAAHCGARVALVERTPYPGGAGINTGTVPSKCLREAALYYSGLRQRGLYGIDYALRDNLSVPDFLYRAHSVIATERALLAANLERNGVAVLQGDATLADPHTIQVRSPDGDVRSLRAAVILVATGAAPHHPPGIPFDHPRVFDSDEILRDLERIPASMAVVGGGVIGCEYAATFTALGVHVTLIDGRERLLPFVDAELATRLQAQLEALGLQCRFRERVTAVQPEDDAVRLQLGSGTAVEAEIALFAAGRTSNTRGLGLEAVGVQLGARGLILVNEHYQTSVPTIYAAGDVIGFPALASTGMEQARVAMAHAFDLAYKQRVATVQPLAVYTIPELAMVGLTEAACQAQGLTYLVGRAFAEKNPRGQIIGDSSGMLKLLFAPADKRLLGVHHLGEQASELVHIGAQVLAAEGTIDAFVEAVYNYPSLADLYKYAANDGLDALDVWRAQHDLPTDRG